MAKDVAISVGADVPGHRTAESSGDCRTSDFLCSVIIATFNRSRLLQRLLDSLKLQDIGADSFEVIVVDDGSEDGTQTLLEKVEVPFALRVIRQSNQGPGAARNRAIEAATSDVIVCLDDDVVATPSLLRQHLAVHAAHTDKAATGVMALPPTRRLSPWLEWEAVALQKQYDSMTSGLWPPTARQFYTANASFRRSAALKARLFDPAFRRAEDVEFAYRLSDIGVSFEFLPSAIVHHEPNRTYREWLKVPRLYGYYDVAMWRDKGRHHIMDLLPAEFRERNKALKFVARFLVGRGRMLACFSLASRLLSNLAFKLGLRKLSLEGYSATFNLQYWQGVSDALGGRRVFWEHVHPS